MKLGYRIIWVDDTPAWVSSVVDDIKEHLEAADCEPAIERLEDGKDLLKKCTDADLDLLIIDQNLPGDDGNVLISQVRKAGNFTEIVYYSQVQPVTELIGVVDGVFHCQRDDAPEKIKAVIDLTLHKLKDLGVVRGLVIASAIDLEVRIEEVMVKLFEATGGLFRDRILDVHYLDCAKKFMFLQGVLKDRIENTTDAEKLKKLREAKEVLKKFDEEIIDNRNILAHSRRVEKDGKIILQGLNNRTAAVAFDAEWLSNMRRNLRKHMQNLDVVEILLCGGA